MLSEYISSNFSMKLRERIMYNIFYLIGLIVVILAVLNLVT